MGEAERQTKSSREAGSREQAKACKLKGSRQQPQRLRQAGTGRRFVLK
jgi:hypothetical protein